MVNANDELKVLTGGDRHVFLPSGFEVYVNPFKFRDWSKVFAILKKYGNAVQDSDFVTLLLSMGEEAVADLETLSLLSTTLTAEELGDLDGDDAIALFFKVFEVNADFFVRGINEGAERLGRTLAGQTASNASSATDTSGEISKATPSDK